jgi:very-short-patch-repair endonuclease
MLLDTDRTMIGGIPVAGIELVLLQLGSVMGGRRIEGIIDHALRQRLTTTERLQERLDLLGRSGRDGAGVLRAALRLRGPGHATTESKLERAFADLVAESRLPTPRLQHEVRNRQGGFIARVDAAWPTAGVAVELDGRSFHEPLDRWNRDLDRQNRLMVEGWTVLRFTWWDVHDRPAQVVRSLRRLLEAAA